MFTAFLIHVADPQSRSVVITIFARGVCKSVPTFQNLVSQNNFQVNATDGTGTVGLAEWIIDDSCIFDHLCICRLLKLYKLELLSLRRRVQKQPRTMLNWPSFKPSSSKFSPLGDLYLVVLPQHQLYLPCPHKYVFRFFCIACCVS